LSVILKEASFMAPVVLVTGGSGFVGTWVVRELLAQNARVVVLDSNPAPQRWQCVLEGQAAGVTLANASLTDRDAVLATMKQRGVTHVIHLAAMLTPACQSDPFLGCQVNVLGSTAVFDAARLSGQIQSISYASSYAVYGAEPRIGESETPPMFYGAFKQAVDLIAEQYWRHYGIRSVAIRPHVVYGPERDQGLTAGPSLACRAAARGESYVIGYTGTVGYDYVEDVASAFVRCAFECPPGSTIVDLPSERATPDDFVRLIEGVVPESKGRISISGPAIPPNIPPIPREIGRLLPDWTPTPLHEGVRKTVGFYRCSTASPPVE
jgi:nucleoside-diphosphate-sugar epimerase